MRAVFEGDFESVPPLSGYRVVLAVLADVVINSPDSAATYQQTSLLLFGAIKALGDALDTPSFEQFMDGVRARALRPWCVPCRCCSALPEGSARAVRARLRAITCADELMTFFESLPLLTTEPEVCSGSCRAGCRHVHVRCSSGRRSVEPSANALRSSGCRGRLFAANVCQVYGSIAG